MNAKDYDELITKTLNKLGHPLPAGRVSAKEWDKYMAEKKERDEEAETRIEGSWKALTEDEKHG
jgi:hypothetical protein